MNASATPARRSETYVNSCGNLSPTPRGSRWIRLVRDLAHAETVIAAPAPMIDHVSSEEGP
ncbi:hypothetical protein GCM10023175_36640 [Pseudonocardia xishanensis]|uniref:Uncharacterized protein n=1 Tax=Pseudonocardia xishanensis TaxID=630995 RepID=A0ABP8RW22_9PSEU